MIHTSPPQASSLSIKLKGITWLSPPPQPHLTLELIYGTQVQTMQIQVNSVESQPCSSVSEPFIEFNFDLESVDCFLRIRFVLADGNLFFCDTIDLVLVDYCAEVLTIVKYQEKVYGWILLQLSQEDKLRHQSEKSNQLIEYFH